MATLADPSGRCSPTGYEAFLEDSIQSAVKSDTIHEQASEKEPAPSSGTAPSAKTIAAGAESWTTSITTEAQGLITNYFSPEPCPEIPCGDKSVPTGCTDLPQLAASSSSENSNGQRGNEETPSSAEENLSSFANKISSTRDIVCQMDTICAKIEFEKEKGPSKPALTEQGELLRIEGPPPPKSWTEELSSKVQDAQRVISSKTHCLFIALGLSTKKEQTLMTDFYTTQSAKQLKPKKESENKAPASSVPFSAQYLVTAIGLGSKVESKEKKQTLMTEFDPNKAPPAVLVAEKTSSTVSETKTNPEKSEIPDVPTVVSETTIATEVRDEEKQTKWNLWKQVKSFMSKFKLAERNTPTFGALAVPKVEVPSLPSFGAFLCNPKVADEEPTAKVAKTDDGQVMVEVAKVEVIKVEKTKVEETKVEEAKVKETKVEETKVEEAKVEMANAKKAKTEENKND